MIAELALLLQGLGDSAAAVVGKMGRHLDADEAVAAAIGLPDGLQRPGGVPDVGEHELAGDRLGRAPPPVYGSVVAAAGKGLLKNGGV